MQINYDKLREAIKESGYKTDYLAKRVGVDRSTISRFLSGKTNISGPAAILLAQIIRFEALFDKAS